VIDVEMEGLQELLAAFGAAGGEVTGLVANALKEEADEAFLLTQQVVPVRDGVLKSSGLVETAVIRGTSVETSIRYGGGGADYAIYVHEIPPNSGGRWGTGNKHAPPTRYKYLEYPVKLYSRGMGERMKVRVVDMIFRRFSIG
jgi:hypothetical protein